MQVNLHRIQNHTLVKAKHEVWVNPCLLSSNKSRPHFYTYVDLIKGRKGAVLVASDREFDQAVINAKLSLQHRELTTSSLYLRLEYYL